MTRRHTSPHHLDALHAYPLLFHALGSENRPLRHQWRVHAGYYTLEKSKNKRQMHGNTSSVSKFVGLFNPWRRVADFAGAFSMPNAGRPWLDGIMNAPKTWYWVEGRLSNDLGEDRDFPNLHFLGWNKAAWIKQLVLDAQSLKLLAGSGQWRVDQSGFHPEELSVES